MNKKDNKKIGILTMFYKSRNYGAVLQSYALYKILDNNGFHVEQICYDEKYEYSFLRRIYRPFERITNRLLLLIKADCDISKTEKIIYDWSMNNIRHSKNVYSKINIYKTNSKYDCFIAGSDQIWTYAFSDVYLLGFVNGKKHKISYAASLGNTSLPEKTKIKFSKYLSSYNAISVREETGQKLLTDCVDIPIYWCLDPTLLLEKKDWDMICSKRMYEKQYVFCYFLGENESSRILAKEYAIKNNKDIIIFPYLQGKFNRKDFSVNGINIYYASPSDFLSYIKYADIIFTDSFHASVFSIIYDKNFFTFARNQNDETTGRLYSLTKIFNCTDRFINEKRINVDYFDLVDNNIYNHDLYEKKRIESLNYLLDAVKNY